MSILYGLYHPDEGEIVVDGEPVKIDSPSRAIELGIGMVHQHFMLVPVMTVDREHRARRRAAQPAAGMLDVREGARGVKELSERYGLAVDPDAVIEDVTVGAQQRVEILKTLYRDARILVLDEPTAVLTAQEAGELFEVLNALAGGRRRDRLHQPQAQRGARDRRPGDGPATRQEDRHGADRGADRGEPRAADGRPRRAPPGRQGGRRRPATRSSRSRTCGCATTAGWRRCAALSLEVRGGRDRGAGGRRRQRPARAR